MMLLQSIFGSEYRLKRKYKRKTVVESSAAPANSATNSNKKSSDIQEVSGNPISSSQKVCSIDVISYLPFQ